MPSGRPHNSPVLLSRRLNSPTSGKRFYVSNRFSGFSRSHAGWRAASVAAQPNLGVCAVGRIGFASGHPDRSGFDRQDLSKLRRQIIALRVISQPIQGSLPEAQDDLCSHRRTEDCQNEEPICPLLPEPLAGRRDGPNSIPPTEN